MVDRDKKAAWESMVTGLSFEEGQMIQRFISISMRLGNGNPSPELIQEADLLNEQFMESGLSQTFLLVFGDEIKIVPHCDFVSDGGRA
jgi:hypothetical protein